MVQFPFAILLALRVFFRTRGDAALEILALRQQVAVLKRKRPRPPLYPGDRLFWTTLRRLQFTIVIEVPRYFGGHGTKTENQKIVSVLRANYSSLHCRRAANPRIRRHDYSEVISAHDAGYCRRQCKANSFSSSVTADTVGKQ